MNITTTTTIKKYIIFCKWLYQYLIKKNQTGFYGDFVCKLSANPWCNWNAFNICLCVCFFPIFLSVFFYSSSSEQNRKEKNKILLTADHLTKKENNEAKVLKLKSYDFKKTYYLYPIENMHVLTFFLSFILSLFIRFVWNAIGTHKHAHCCCCPQ